MNLKIIDSINNQDILFLEDSQFKLPKVNKEQVLELQLNNERHHYLIISFSKTTDNLTKIYVKKIK